jgi:acyl carrier protein
MVPALFIALSALPKTPNGKFDRHALPAPEQAQILSSATFVAPTTPLQVQLAELWAQKLHLTKVGITDNFFKLGGHSLAAVEIITHLRERFQVSISLRNLFETPTITALAQLIEQELALKQEEDPTEDTEFAQILQDLEAFSNDEVEQMFSSSEGK